MNALMATKNTSNLKLHECTAFVLHKSQQTNMSNVPSNIIDYTEHKLVHYADSIIDVQQKQVILALLVDYKCGRVAIAFRKGLPVYIKVVKES